jgi:hypothetical protein
MDVVLPKLAAGFHSTDSRGDRPRGRELAPEFWTGRQVVELLPNEVILMEQNQGETTQKEPLTDV